MSEDKLQEIREDYWYELSEGNVNYRPCYITDEYIEKLMRLAYNQGLEDAADSARIDLQLMTDGEAVHKIKIDKQSILKLKL